MATTANINSIRFNMIPPYVCMHANPLRTIGSDLIRFNEYRFPITGIGFRARTKCRFFRSRRMVMIELAARADKQFRYSKIEVTFVEETLVAGDLSGRNRVQART